MPNSTPITRDFFEIYLNKSKPESREDVQVLMQNCDPASAVLKPNRLELERLIRGLADFCNNLKDDEKKQFKNEISDIKNYIAKCIGVYSDYYHCYFSSIHGKNICNRKNISHDESYDDKDKKPKLKAEKPFGEQERPFDVELFFGDFEDSRWLTYSKIKKLFYRGVALHSMKAELPNFMEQAYSKGLVKEIFNISLHEIKVGGGLTASKNVFEKFTDKDLSALNSQYLDEFKDYLIAVFHHVKNTALSQEYYKRLYSVLVELCVKIGAADVHRYFNGEKPKHTDNIPHAYHLPYLWNNCVPLINQILLLIVIKGQIKIEAPKKGELYEALLTDNLSASKDEKLVSAHDMLGKTQKADRKWIDEFAERNAVYSMAALMRTDNTAEQNRKYFLLTYLHDVLGFYRDHPTFKKNMVRYSTDPVFKILTLLRLENQPTLFTPQIILAKAQLNEVLTQFYCVATHSSERDLSQEDKRLLGSICEALRKIPHYYQALAHQQGSMLLDQINGKARPEARVDVKAKEKEEASTELKSRATPSSPMPIVERTAAEATISLETVNNNVVSMMGLLQNLLKENQELRGEVRQLNQKVSQLESQLSDSKNSAKVTSAPAFFSPA